MLNLLGIENEKSIGLFSLRDKAVGAANVGQSLPVTLCFRPEICCPSCVGNRRRNKPIVIGGSTLIESVRIIYADGSLKTRF